MSKWYQGKIDYEVPKFIKNIKELILERFEIIEKKSKLINKVRDGISYIENNPEEKAFKKLYEIYIEIDSLDNRIKEIDVEITAILEAKLSEIGFIIKKDKGENDLFEISESKDIYCLPWKASLEEEKCVMSPEDIWLFGMARKMFNANPNNISFISKDELENLQKGDVNND